MSCDPVRLKQVSAQAGSTGMTASQSAFPEDAEALTVHGAHAGRRSKYATLYLQVADENRQFKRKRVRYSVGEDLGMVTNNPAYNGLILDGVFAHINNSVKVEFMVENDGLSPGFVFFVSGGETIPWGELQYYRRKAIREDIDAAIEGGRQVPHEYLLEIPDLIEPYLASAGGAQDKADDPASILRLRLAAGFEVNMNELVKYPDLIAEYGGV